MTQLILVPGNPLALPLKDLRPLIEQIEQGSDLSVEVRAFPQRGYAVTWWEVLIIYVLTKGDVVIEHILKEHLDDLTEKVKRWYRERRAKKDNKRPLSLTFRDGKGHALRQVNMQATGVTETEPEGPPRLPPPKAPQRKASEKRAKRKPGTRKGAKGSKK
jgi:hypothetical protein